LLPPQHWVPLNI